MQDSVRDAFGVALKYLGYSLNSTDLDELQAAKNLLIEQKPLVQAYVIDQVRDKMIGNEAALAVIYSGEAITCQIPGLFQKMQRIRNTQKNSSTSSVDQILQK